MKENFDIFLIVMALLAAVVYAALHFFEAGYGYLFDRRYGPPVPNRVGWMVMESPVFILMCVLWASSERMWQAGPLALFCLFQAHYLQRAFIFPLLIRGKGRMPLGIVVMGMVFNTLNALMQGGWIFYVSPADYYAGWFAQPYIYIGGALFVAGMAVNLHSDHIIRHLRRPGDTRHYIPRGGMFRYVSSANYFGELLEWVGFAVACGRGPERSSHGGPSPTSRRAPHRCAAATSRSSAKSFRAFAANGSSPSSIDPPKRRGSGCGWSVTTFFTRFCARRIKTADSGTTQEFHVSERVLRIRLSTLNF